MSTRPSSSRVLQVALLSDRGRVRADNQDAVAAAPNAGALLVADGVGGGPAGDVASRIAADTALRRLRRPPMAVDAVSAEARLRRALETANSAVLEAAQEPGRHGMASTIAAALFHPEGLSVAWAGDSRAYRIGPDAMRRLTCDHCVAASDAGGLRRGRLLCALGIDEPLRFDLISHPALPADGVLLLCTDGLTDLLGDACIQALVCRWIDDLDVAARRLVDCANRRGGYDNVSVVLARGIRRG